VSHPTNKEGDDGTKGTKSPSQTKKCAVKEVDGDVEFQVFADGLFQGGHLHQFYHSIKFPEEWQIENCFRVVNILKIKFSLDKWMRRSKIKNERSFEYIERIMPQETQTKGERTHQALLEAAYVLFLEQGFAATSMRQIAKKAGLALGGIYNHFSSKEAIFSELILERHPYKQILPILLKTPGNDIETFVRSAASAMVDELGKRPDFIKLMLIEMVEFNGRNMTGLVQHILPQILPVMGKFDHGNLRPIPPFVFFRAFLGLFFSYFMTELLLANTPASMKSTNALDDFVEIFLHGVTLIPVSSKKDLKELV
jgi:AcrR family transcriptional regulator